MTQPNESGIYILESRLFDLAAAVVDHLSAAHVRNAHPTRLQNSLTGAKRRNPKTNPTTVATWNGWPMMYTVIRKGRVITENDKTRKSSALTAP